MEDLFSMLEPQVAHTLRTEQAAEAPRSPAIQDVLVDGVEYRIRRTVDREDEDRDGKRDNPRSVFQIFRLQEGREYRLYLLGPDAASIPHEVLYRAENMLDWAEGRYDRWHPPPPPMAVHDDTWA